MSHYNNKIIHHREWTMHKFYSRSRHGTIYLLLSESQHHLTPSNVTSKLTTLPRHNSHYLAPTRTTDLIFLTLVHYQIFLHELTFEKYGDKRCGGTVSGLVDTEVDVFHDARHQVSP